MAAEHWGERLLQQDPNASPRLWPILSVVASARLRIDDGTKNLFGRCLCICSSSEGWFIAFSAIQQLLDGAHTNFEGRRME